MARGLVLPLLAVSAAACLDGPTGPLTVGEMRMRATFAPGEDPAAFGLTIDSMRVTALRRSPVEAVVDTVMPFSSGAALSWLVDLAADPETFDADVELYGGTDTLYAGSASFAVAMGFADGRPTNDVPLQYVGAPVSSPIAEIVVSPARVTIVALGTTVDFTAEARDASGAVIPGVTFGWSSSATGVATIGQGTGTATAVAEGSTTITASAGGASGTATLDVDLTGGVIASIVVTPASATLTGVGDTQAFSAAASDAAGDPVIGAAFAWASSVPAVATIDGATGTATAAGEGTTTISAAADGATGTASLTVDLGGGGSSVISVVVTPSSVTLASLGATQQYSAQAFDAGGQPISGVTFAWTSGDGGVATIDASTGVATAIGEGTTTITAAAGGVTGSATLTVDLGGGGGSGIASIVVSPPSATLSALGATQQYTAQAFDAGGQPVSGVTLVWTSGDGTVATIDASSGLATATGEGTTTITAAAGGVTGSATLTVDLGGGSGSGIASIVVTPSSATLSALGAVQQYMAQAFDAAGQPIGGVTFAWSSSDAAVATVDPATGLATAIGNGSTMIEASAGGVTGTASLDVAQVAVQIVVSPDTVRFDALGQTAQFTAVTLDVNGHAVAGATFVWSSSDPLLATIDPVTGLATAVDGRGVVTITATGQGPAMGLTGTAVALVRP